MIKNYFKTAWRSLWKNKVYSLIINIGLIAGYGCMPVDIAIRKL